MPLPVVEITPKKPTVSSAAATPAKPSPSTSSNQASSPEIMDSKSKESSVSVNNDLNTADKDKQAFSTFTTGVNKSHGQVPKKPRKNDGRSTDTAPSSTGGGVDQSTESVSSESDIDRDKHDSVYGAVWFATSGDAIRGRQQPELSLAGGQDVYEELNPEPASNLARQIHLSYKIKETKSETSSIDTSRDSTLSFNVPEPTFTPPPLPPGTQLENFTKAAIAQATSQNRPPPAVPPRPRNISNFGSGSTTSLTSPQ